MQAIEESEFILNSRGAVYHLDLRPEELATTILTVGDPDRVQKVTRHFDVIEHRGQHREFVTHTGRIGQKRLTVISTGIGTDNIDIVLNELDALVNIDLQTRLSKTSLQSLNIIRIGTSGAVQADIPLNSLLVSEAAIGLDTLMHYYRREQDGEETQILNDFKRSLPQNSFFVPYIASASEALIGTLANGLLKGITITTPGFYAPQCRQVRAQTTYPELMAAIQNFNSAGKHIANIEMETAGIYGLASVLCHRAISFNVILANRATQEFSKQPQSAIGNCIKELLERLTNSF